MGTSLVANALEHLLMPLLLRHFLLALLIVADITFQTDFARR
jgi:hypothetical protein